MAHFEQKHEDLSVDFDSASPRWEKHPDHHTEVQRQLAGESLTTAEINYHMPDYPKILQCFVWQTLDVAPNFPRLLKFLSYWQSHIEADLHYVTVAHRGLLSPTRMKLVDGVFLLH